MTNKSVAQTSGNLAFTYYFLLKLAPSIVSLIAIYFGYKLFILGVTGKASLIVNADTVKLQLLNAAPGLFFAIGGLIALIFIIKQGVKIDLGSESEDDKIHNKDHWASTDKLSKEQFAVMLDVLSKGEVTREGQSTIEEQRDNIRNTHYPSA